MSSRDIIVLPNPLLFKKSLKVSEIDAELKELIKDMFQVMYSKGGIGLAAVQVSVLKRVMVIDVPLSERIENSDLQTYCKPMVVINPVLTFPHPEITVKMEEGCLSIPNKTIKITRPEEVVLKYMDENGNNKIVRAGGLLSRCLQHEVEHLNGILMTKHISQIELDISARKARKARK